MNPAFNPERKFGVELEVITDADPIDVCNDIERATGVDVFKDDIEGYWHNTDPDETNWTAKSDSSIEGDGFELVSPPLKGERGLEEVERVVDELANLCSSHHSCGLHVHHEIRDFDDERLVNIYKVYYSFSPVITFLLPPERRNNGYCPPLNSSVRSWGKTPKAQKDHLMLGERYALNLSSFKVRGTVEFRQHQSTTNSNKILAWLFLTQSIVEYAKEVKNPKEYRELKLRTMFRRLGWTGDALLDARTRWVRAYWEERFLRFTRGALVAPVELGLWKEVKNAQNDG